MVYSYVNAVSSLAWRYAIYKIHWLVRLRLFAAILQACSMTIYSINLREIILLTKEREIWNFSNVIKIFLERVTGTDFNNALIRQNVLENRKKKKCLLNTDDLSLHLPTYYVPQRPHKG